MKVSRVPVCLLVLAALSSQGCAARALGALGALEMRAGVAAMARVSVADAAVARAAAAATRAGTSALATDATALRAAGAGLGRPRLLSGATRAQVVGESGEIVGMVEQLGADRLLVRSSRTDVPITAVRQGNYIRYRSAGSDVGHSVLKDGRIHHYLHDAQGTRYMGYDQVVNGRVFQYDADGLLIREMTLRVPADIGAGAAALIVAPLALVSSDPDRRQQAETLLEQIGTIRRRLKR